MKYRKKLWIYRFQTPRISEKSLRIKQ